MITIRLCYGSQKIGGSGAGIGKQVLEGSGVLNLRHSTGPELNFWGLKGEYPLLRHNADAWESGD